MITPENNSLDHELLAKYFAGETTIAESEKVDAWLAESDENWAEFDRLSQIWNGEKSNPLPSFDSKKAWNKVEGQLSKDDTRVEDSSTSFNIRKYLIPIAAALIGMIAITMTYQSFLTDDQFKMLVAQTEENTKEVILPDGSVVHLNEHSLLEYPTAFAEDERWVKLKGEAFFEVERDTSRQFEINVNNGIVTVLGTTFNVKSTTTTVEVTVETGKVALASEKHPEKRMILEAGDKAVYDLREKQINRLVDIDPNYLFWKNRILVFDETPLIDVVEELNSKYEVEILLSSSDLENCKFSGTFKDQQIEAILEVLVSTFKLEVETAGSQIILSGNGCD